jgi:putative acetyltransferase
MKYARVLVKPPPESSRFRIRRARRGDRLALVDIWWRSAQATHHFVAPDELAAMHTDVTALRLERLDTWVLCAGARRCGFLVMDGNDVAALFIAPEWLRRGGGGLLMRYARARARPLTVQVNEQNAAALGFYRAEGFRVVGRSATDSAGRPYPLLRMAETRRRSEG